jgi:hypothetical protein
MSITSRVITVLLVLALAGAVVGGITWAYEIWRDSVLEEGDDRGAARVQKLWDEDRARAQAEALAQAQAGAKETQRRLDHQQENQRAQDALLARSRADNARLASAVDRLQLRASAYLDAAGCSSLAGDPAVECVRQAAAQVVDVLGRDAARHRQLALDADDARARGLKCEADYDALTSPSN